MKIFVTGATGFIGSHLVHLAQSQGHDVVALRLAGSKPRISFDRQPKWLDGELSDDWSEALAGCDVFVHLAAYGVASGSNNWQRCFQVNVLDSIRLWQQAVAVGIKRFLIVGSCFEYGRSGLRYDAIPVTAPLEPTTAYGASKAAASMAALALAVEHQLRLVVVRPFHVYGEGEAPERFWPSLVAAAKEGKDYPMTLGEQIRDFVPVTSATDLMMQIAISTARNESFSNGPLVVNLGSGHPRTLKAFAEEQWKRQGATGELKIGAVSYRDNEVMRYVPHNCF